jgi:glycosyltransferase involved in cell wall biosynthesis
MLFVPPTDDRSRAESVSAALCLDRTAFERFGGILRHLCVGLVDQNVPLRIVGSDPRVESLRLGPVQAFVHPPIAGLTGRRRLERLLDALSAQPPTVVHAVAMGSYRTAASIAQEFDADLVLGVTSLDDIEELGRFGERADVHFQPWSNALAGILDARRRVDRTRVEVIAPGVPAAAKPAAFDHPGRVATLVSTSRFDVDSGLDRLIAAVEILVKKEVKLQLFLLGEGPRERVLRKSVRARKLSGHIAFAPNFDDPTAALSSADLFIHPQSSSAFPAETLQAMGMGLALVTGPDEITDHHRSNETARVCADGSTEALADAIESLLRDRPAAQRLAAAGLEHVRRNHGVSAMAERAAAAYRRLVLNQSTFAIRGS